MVTQIIVIIILTLINGVFALSEVALIQLNDNKVKAKAEQGDKKSIQIAKLIEDSNRFLSTIQIGITLAGYLSSAFASDAFASQLATAINSVLPGIPLTVLDPISVVLVTLILSYFSIVLGEMVPKRLALKDPEKLGYMVGPFITIMAKVTSPVVSFLSMSTNFVVRLFGIDPDEDDSSVTEEEIRMMTDVAEEKGEIQENEKMMINNIFNFDNTPVSDVMTHRTDVVAIDVTDSLDSIKEIVFNGRFSRYPVYEESVDNIIGVIHLRDLLKFHQSNIPTSEFDMSKIMRKPYFVPDSIYADELFFELQSKNINIAIVVDEYGGTAGVVSIEDLIEEIVGDIFDEYDDHDEEEIVKIDEHSYVFEGDVPLDRVEEIIYCDLPLDDYDTISGFMIGLLGRLPQPSDRGVFEFNGYEFSILSADHRVIHKVGVKKLPEEDQEEED